MLKYVIKNLKTIKKIFLRFYVIFQREREREKGSLGSTKMIET